MEPATQRIVCCIGQSVAGRATQFLMHRLFVEHGLDWVVFSVEVAEQDLEAAIAGCRAMGFAGLRFFDPYDVQVANAFAPRYPSSPAPLGFTSAMLDGEQWVGWHNLGRGALDRLLREGVSIDDALVWVHGDSPLALSSLAAMAERPPRHLFWSRAQGALGEAVESWPGIASPVGLSDLPAAITAAVAPADPAKEQLPAGSIPDFIVISDDPIELQPDQVEAIVAAVSGKNTDAGNPGEAEAHGATDPPKSMRAADVLRVSLVGDAACTLRKHIPSSFPQLTYGAREVALSGEAFDFEVWTGIEPNWELLLDAYDEFYDL